MPQYQAPDGRIIESEQELDPQQLAQVFSYDMRDRISSRAAALGVPPEIGLGVANVESGLRHVDENGILIKNPESSASGIFQLTDAARKAMNLKSEGVNENIDAGLGYLKKQADAHNGNWPIAVAAYKQGAGSIKRDGVQPETQSYLDKVFAGMMKGAGALGGGVLGNVAAPGPVGTGVGAGLGYSLGKSLAQDIGYEPRENLVKNLLESGTVAAGTAGGMVAGPPGFVGGTELASLVQRELESRFSGQGDIDVTAPSQTKILGKQLFNFPGGAELQNMSTNALLDLGARLGIKGLEAYTGVRGLKARVGEETEKGAKDLATETSKFSGEAEADIGKAKLQASRIQEDSETAAQKAQAQIEQQIKRQFGPQVAQQKYAELVGKTQADVAAERPIDPADGGVPTQVAAQNRDRIANAVFAPQRRIQNELSKQYEDLLEKHGDAPVELEPLNTGIRMQVDSLTKNNLMAQLSPKTMDLLGQAQAMSHPDSGATMRDLLRLRSNASKWYAEAPTPLDQSVAHGVVDHALKTMEESGFETSALKALNSRYKYFRDAFRGVNSQVSPEIDPGDWGKRVFLDKEAAQRLYNAATPEEQSDLRSALGTYIFSRKNVQSALQDVGEATLSRYFGKTAFGRASAWIATEPKLVSLDKLLADSPEANQAFRKSLSDRAEQLTNDYGRKMTDAALVLANKLGPAGKQMERDLLQAKSPMEQAQLAAQFIDEINPQKAVDLLKGTQQSPSSMAISAMSQLPKDAYATILKRKAAWLGSLSVAETLIHGHPGVWSAAGVGAAVVSLPGTLVKNGFISALHDPHLATMFVHAVNSGAWDNVAKTMADILVADSVSKSQRENQ